MKIYFAGSISAGRQDRGRYDELIKVLSEFGEVLTEHIADESLTEEGESLHLPAKVIHDRDLAWLAESDILVGEVTVPSLGVGYEVAKAEEWGKGILLFYRRGKKPLSPMLSGADGVTWHDYESVEEAKGIFKEFSRTFIKERAGGPSSK